MLNEQVDGLRFFHIAGEIKAELYGDAGIAVVVVTVYVSLQLPAVSDNLLATLLESDLHV